MTPNQEYLAGYKHATRNVQALRSQAGWAVGKGRIKSTVQFYVGFFMTPGKMEQFDAGYVDAYLDSVGC